MVSLALFVGLLTLVPIVSGVLLIAGSRALSRLVATSWCVVVLLLIRLLTYGDTLQATAFAPAGCARWLQLSYLVDNFTIFSALVIGVLASAVAVVLIALEPAQVEQPQTEPQGRIGPWNRAWQLGVLLLVLGAVFLAIFSNSALWTVLGWSLAGLGAFILSGQGQTANGPSSCLPRLAWRTAPSPFRCSQRSAPWQISAWISSTAWGVSRSGQRSSCSPRC
jgi:formate hydrogenlyase subunit 3/multisubunit Na+/H+ antiporter MnhD subunit